MVGFFGAKTNTAQLKQEKYPLPILPIMPLVLCVKQIQVARHSPTSSSQKGNNPCLLYGRDSLSSFPDKSFLLSGPSVSLEQCIIFSTII